MVNLLVDDPYEEDLISKYDDPDYTIDMYDWPYELTAPPRSPTPPTPDPYAVVRNAWGYPSLRQAYPGCVGPQSIPTETFLNIMSFSIAQAMQLERPQEFIVKEGYVHFLEKQRYCVAIGSPETAREQHRRFNSIQTVSQVNSRTRAMVLKHYVLVPYEEAVHTDDAYRYIYVFPEMDTVLFDGYSTPALEDFGYLHELFQRLTTIKFTYTEFLQPDNAKCILMLFGMPALKRVELSCGLILVNKGDEVGWMDEYEIIDEDVFPDLAWWGDQYGYCFHAMWKPFEKRGIELIARDAKYWRSSKIAVSIQSTPGGPVVKLLEDPKKLLKPRSQVDETEADETEEDESEEDETEADENEGDETEADDPEV